MVDSSLGSQLWDKGWRQGALFGAPSVCFLWNGLSSDQADGLTAPIRRDLDSKERLVLVSQECDLVASVDNEPRVEALICQLHKGRFLEKIARNNSARWFTIDPSQGLVAHARYRVLIEKTALLEITPEAWPASPQRLQRFVDWLARRYDRPALRAPLDSQFQAPVCKAIQVFHDEDPELFDAFNGAVRQLRFWLPTVSNPPFDIELMILLEDKELNQDEAESIRAIQEVIRASVDASVIQIGNSPLISPVEETSLADYFDTVPLYLDYFSFGGEEVMGAEPFPRA